MGSIFAYSITSSVLLVAMYLIYKWMLAGENQHAYNRAILLCIYLLALAAPFFVPSIAEWLAGTSRANVEFGNIEIGESVAIITPEAEPSVLPRILLGVYIVGVLFAFLYTLVIAGKLWRTIRGGRRYAAGKFTLIVTQDTNVAPFSWLKYIVMSDDDYRASADVIITHESRHLQLNHWVDLLVAQLIAILQWFNPAAWLMREELKTVHEYQADEAVIASGANPKEYQMLLIKKAVGARFPSLANSLNHSKLKKRVTMMYKTKSSVGRRLRALAIVPSGILAVLALNQSAVASAINAASEATIVSLADGKVTQNVQDVQGVQGLKLNGQVVSISGASGESAVESTAGKTTIYVNGVKQEPGFDMNSINPADIASVSIVKNGNNPGTYITLKGESDKGSARGEKMPEFPGGYTAMLNWLSQNVNYPEKLKDEKVGGIVSVNFQILADGSIGEAKVVRSVHPDLDAEALRAVKAMPKWTPGTVDGKPVAVWFTIPIAFKAVSSEDL